MKGVLDVEYFLEKHSRKLRFNATVYRQDCKNCKETCMPDEYLDELERVAEEFSNKIFKILFGIKKENHCTGKDSNMTADHQSHLCEACRLGKCKLKDIERESELSSMFSSLSLGRHSPRYSPRIQF